MSCLIYTSARRVVTTPADCAYLFAYYEQVKSILFNGAFNTAEVTDMRCMFQVCYNIEELDLSSFDTANATNMSRMFYKCGSLKTLNVSSLDTAKVRYMRSMFSNCSSLEALDLSSFHTFNVANMEKMFYKCGKLTTLKVVNWNTVDINTNEMFTDCSLPQEIISAILSGKWVSTAR